MVQWIAISVTLVCLSGSSVSHNLVRLDEEDYRWKAAFSENSDEKIRSTNIIKYDRVPEFWENGDDYNNPGYGHENAHNVRHLNIQKHSTERKEHNFGNDHGYYGHYRGDYDYNDEGFRNSETEYSGRHGKYGSHGRKCVHHRHDGSFRQQDRRKDYGHMIVKGSPRGLSQNNLKSPHRSSTSPSDADRVVFPDWDKRVPTTYRSPQPIRPTTKLIIPTRTTTDRTLLNQVICLQQCPTTSEYNPVCGTNNITYSNPGALQCARNCGLNVAVARQAPCPRLAPHISEPNDIRPFANKTTRTPSSRQTNTSTPVTIQTTVRPRPTVPTARTTHHVNVSSYLSDSTLIPLHILEMVFGNAYPTKGINEEPEFDIVERMNL